MTKIELQELHDKLKELSQQCLSALDTCYYWLDNNGIRSENNSESVKFFMSSLKNLQESSNKINDLLKDYEDMRGLTIDFPLVFLNLDHVNFNGVNFDGSKINLRSYHNLCPHLPNQRAGFIGCNISNSSFERCNFEQYFFCGVKSNFPEQFFKTLKIPNPDNLSATAVCSFNNCNFKNSKGNKCMIYDTSLTDCDFSNALLYNSYIGNSLMSFHGIRKKSRTFVGNYPMQLKHCYIENLTLNDPFIFQRSSLPKIDLSSCLTGLNTEWGGVSFSIRNESHFRDFVDDRKKHERMNEMLRNIGSKFLCFSAKLPDFESLKRRFPKKVEIIDSVKNVILSKGNQGVFSQYADLPQMMIRNAIASVVQHPKEETLFASLVSEFDANIRSYEDMTGKSEENRGKTVWVTNIINAEPVSTATDANLGACNFDMPDDCTNRNRTGWFKGDDGKWRPKVAKETDNSSARKHAANLHRK